MLRDKKKDTASKRTSIPLLPAARVRVFGTTEDNHTYCEIPGLYRDENGNLQSIPLLGIEMLTEIEGFSFSGDSEKFKMLCEFVDGLFWMLLQASNDDVKAQQQIEAVRRVIFAKELGIGKTKIAEILKFRTVPSAKAHAWLLFILIRLLSPIVQPLDESKVFASDRIRLKDNLPNNHALVQIARKNYVRGKVNTTQSLAFRIYRSLMAEQKIKMPSLKDLQRELKAFLRFHAAGEEESIGCIQQLKIEGFDFDLIIGGKG